MKSAPVLANKPIDITIPALPAQPSLVTSSQLRLCRLPIHHTAALLTLVASQERCKRRGAQAPVVMLRGGGDSLGDPLLSWCLWSLTQHLAPEVLQPAQRLGGHGEPTPALGRPVKHRPDQRQAALLTR
jgi:hypothetical protein